MEFQTKIEIVKSKIKIGHDGGIMLLGSCFADNVGERLENGKFNLLKNPFGTLYNPLSIANLINHAIDEREYTPDSKEIFQHDGVFHSWLHHSQFDSQSAEELAFKINEARRKTTQMLKNGRTLIVTLGTSIAYFLKETGDVVSNCHKMNDCLFDRRMLKSDEITSIWIELLYRLKEYNQRLQVIFTVSPIRHKRDGYHINQLSKGNLLIAIDQILNAAEFIDTAYFPSYEIMMDELRDYRFYDDDMIHPSPLAIQHIWERFSDTHFDKGTKSLCNQCIQIQKALAHKTDNPASNAYKSFIENTLKQIETIKKRHPYIRMEKEIEICNTRLRK